MAKHTAIISTYSYMATELTNSKEPMEIMERLLQQLSDYLIRKINPAFLELLFRDCTVLFASTYSNTLKLL